MQVCSFETELGVFGLGWRETGVARVHLPGLTSESLMAPLARDGATVSEPSSAVQDVIGKISAYARGVAVDFSTVPLDFRGLPEFHRRTYEALLRIGYGATTTYGALARQLGDVSLSRAVGQAMGANPIPLIIPCHRVLASGGKPGGFSAPGGADAKLRMLALEGVQIGPPDTGQQSFGF